MSRFEIWALLLSTAQMWAFRWGRGSRAGCWSEVCGRRLRWTDRWESDCWSRTGWTRCPPGCPRQSNKSAIGFQLVSASLPGLVAHPVDSCRLWALWSKVEWHSALCSDSSTPLHAWSLDNVTCGALSNFHGPKPSPWSGDHQTVLGHLFEPRHLKVW